MSYVNVKRTLAACFGQSWKTEETIALPRAVFLLAQAGRCFCLPSLSVRTEVPLARLGPGLRVQAAQENAPTRRNISVRSNRRGQERQQESAPQEENNGGGGGGEGPQGHGQSIRHPRAGETPAAEDQRRREKKRDKRGKEDGRKEERKEGERGGVKEREKRGREEERKGGAKERKKEGRKKGREEGAGGREQEGNRYVQNMSKYV